jgi:hypothetical protein
LLLRMAPVLTGEMPSMFVNSTTINENRTVLQPWQPLTFQPFNHAVLESLQDIFYIVTKSKPRCRYTDTEL